MDRTYARVGRRTPLSFSTDVLWSPTGHTLTESTIVLCEQYSGRTPKVPDICYFLEYPPGNTKTYETAFGPLCNSNERTPPRTRRPLFSGPINIPSPLAISHQICPSTPLFALRLPVGRFVSVSVLPKEGTLAILLQGGNTQFP